MILAGKLTLGALFAYAAAGTSLFAVSFEGYPVIIYDETGEAISIGTSLNTIDIDLNGTSGYKAEFSGNDILTSAVTFSKDTFLELASDGQAGREISRDGDGENIFEFSSNILELNFKNISLARCSTAITSMGTEGMLVLGGNASFRYSTSAISVENIKISSASRFYFASCTGPAIIGNVVTEASVDLSFSSNKVSISGDLTLGNNSKFVASSSSDTVIIGTCNFGDDVVAIFENNQNTGIIGSLSVGKNSSVTFNENSIVVGKNEISDFKAQGASIRGSLSAGEGSSLTFNANSIAVETTESTDLKAQGASIYGSLTVWGKSDFTENSVTTSSSGKSCAYGGAMFGGISTESEACLSFSGNTANAISYFVQACCYGGSVALDENQSITAKGTLTFLNNTAYAKLTADGKSVEYSTPPDSCAHGGAVYGNVFGLENSSFSFSGNTARATMSSYARSEVFPEGYVQAYGGAIDGCFSITTNGYAKFSENSANADGLLQGPASAFYSKAFSYAAGGAVHGNVEIGIDTSVSFLSNTSTSRMAAKLSGNAYSYAYGGAVNGNLSVESGGHIIFSKNAANAAASVVDEYYYDEREATSAYSYGGAVNGDIIIHEGADVTFSDNTASADATNTAHAHGGAVHGNITICEGANVSFTGNTASAYTLGYGGHEAFGGAVSSDDTIMIAGNVSFEKNKTFTELAEYGGRIELIGYGGAIYNSSENQSCLISFNTTVPGEKVSFVENSSASGGAIYFCGRLSSSELSNLEFLGNSAASGGAIYANGDAHFSGWTLFQSNRASSSGGAVSGREVCFSGTTTFQANQASHGGAISGTWLYFLADSRTLFSENSANSQSGGAISMREISFSGFADFSSNSAKISGGAVYCIDAISFYSGSTTSFTENSAANGNGGAIYAEGEINFYSGADVSFTRNSIQGNGGAVYAAGTTNFNGVATFSQNTASNGSGGAIYAAETVTFESTAKGTFFGNSIAATEKTDTRGGAICTKTVTLSGELDFTDNTITAVGSTSINSGGGAIYASGVVTFEDTANVKFEGNTISSAATQSFGGGAIFADTLKLAGTVEFTNNSVTNTTLSTLFSSGGAIFSFSGMEIASRTTATFTGNSAAYGGAINANKGYLTFAEDANVTFRGNSAARGGAIYTDAGTFTLAGDVKFLDNTASAQGGAIRIRGALECIGDTTRVVFSGNRLGSDTKGWENNDILLADATSSMAIRDAGMYDFGGGILATAGGSLSIDEANVTFRATSSTAIGGTTTVSGGATVCVEAGATFTTNALTIGSSGKLVFGTQGAESASIVVADAANISLDATACLEVAAYGAYVESTRFQVLEWTSGDGTPLEAVLTRSNFSVLVNGLACDDDRWRFGVDGNSVYVELLTVPEPSIFGLLAGAGALALCLTRRRRRER